MAKDMTQGRPAKLILLFALPLMLGNLFQQLYNTVDAVVVGNFVSEAALSAVGTTVALANFFVFFAVGFCNGSAVIVAQYFGARRMEELRRMIFTAMVLVVGLGITLAILGAVGAKWVLVVLIKVPDSLLDMAVVYFRIYCCGVVFQFVYNIIAAILRALGDSRATLYFLIISSVLNILLDLAAVLLLDLGVAGVALATIISQAVSAVVSVLYTRQRYREIMPGREDMVFEASRFRMVLKVSVPMTVQQCAVSVGGIIMQRLINVMSVAAIAAYTVGVRIESYIVVPISALNVGLTTYTAQNIGAGKTERIPRGWRAAQLMSFAATLVFVAVIYIFPDALVGLFNLGGESSALGVQYLRGMVPSFLIFSCYMMSTSVLHGAGDVYWGAALTTSSLGLRAIFSYLLYYVFEMGFSSMWWALPISWGIVCISAFLRYRFGNWREKAIVTAKAAD